MPQPALIAGSPRDPQARACPRPLAIEWASRGRCDARQRPVPVAHTRGASTAIAGPPTANDLAWNAATGSTPWSVGCGSTPAPVTAAQIPTLSEWMPALLALLLAATTAYDARRRG